MRAAPKQTCPDCGNRFETILPAGTRCGLGRCPSAHAGYGKPPKTSAKGRPVDDRQVRSRAKRVTTGHGGVVNQRSTGFDLLDGCLPAVAILVALLAAVGSLGAWWAVELVAIMIGT